MGVPLTNIVIIFQPEAIVICYRVNVRVVVLNANFTNISVISWRSVLYVQDIGLPEENHRPTVSLTNFIT
jgi:hypothetical protein